MATVGKKYVSYNKKYGGGVYPTLKRNGGGPIRKTTGAGGNYRSTESGAGMTEKGVKAYRRANPGSKLQTAVTGDVKKGSKDAKGVSHTVQDQQDN